MADEIASDDAEVLVAELGRKYLWWRPIGNVPHSADRVIAQAMNLATFEDVRRMEETLGRDCLTAAMLQAEPGWFSDRSWEFWRGRQSHPYSCMTSSPWAKRYPRSRLGDRLMPRQFDPGWTSFPARRERFGLISSRRSGPAR